MDWLIWYAAGVFATIFAFGIIGPKDDMPNDVLASLIWPLVWASFAGRAIGLLIRWKK